MGRQWSPAVPVFRGFSGTPLSIWWVTKKTILQMLLDLWWRYVPINPPKWKMHSGLHCKYGLSTLVSVHGLLLLPNIAREYHIPHVSLAQEKIKLQNSKFGFCWMDIDFWTFVKEEKFAGRAILSWRRLVLWLGVVCFACRVHQPILSIQTNGQIVPLGIDRWAFKMSY